MHQGQLRAGGSTSELKAKLGGGYRLYCLPTASDQVTEQDRAEDLKIFPDAASATKELQTLESVRHRQYQITGPTIEEVFMRLASDDYNAKRRSSDLEKEESLEVPANETVRPGKEKGAVTVDRTSTDIEPPKRRSVRPFHQAGILFMKRGRVLLRNPFPTFFSLIIPIIGAGFLSLLLQGIKNPGCALIDQVKIANNRNLTQSVNPLVVAGPPSAFTDASIDLVEVSLSATAESLGSEGISVLQAVTLVDNYTAFIDFTTKNYANETPGGLWLGDSSSAPTIDYLADIAISGSQGITGVYNAIFLQNFLDIFLTNTSIVVNYQVFDFPWPANTSNTIQFVFYFGLVLAAYPAFFGEFYFFRRDSLSNIL